MLNTKEFLNLKMEITQDPNVEKNVIFYHCLCPILVPLRYILQKVSGVTIIDSFSYLYLLPSLTTEYISIVKAQNKIDEICRINFYILTLFAVLNYLIVIGRLENSRKRKIISKPGST